MISVVRRAWALVGRSERRRLKLVAAYGVLIAALDTVALVLLFVLINVLADQPITGFAARILPSDYTGGADRYRTS